jgi:hypothetical protein
MAELLIRASSQDGALLRRIFGFDGQPTAPARPDRIVVTTSMGCRRAPFRQAATAKATKIMGEQPFIRGWSTAPGGFGGGTPWPMPGAFTSLRSAHTPTQMSAAYGRDRVPKVTNRPPGDRVPR